MKRPGRDTRPLDEPAGGLTPSFQDPDQYRYRDDGLSACKSQDGPTGIAAGLVEKTWWYGSGPNRRFFGDRCRQPASHHGFVPLLGCEGFGELLDQLVLPKLFRKLDQQLP